MVIKEYVADLGNNPYFGAGFGLVSIGAGVAVLRKGASLASVYLRRHYLVTLEVPCRDKSYQWLLQWITVKGAKETQHLSVETSFEKYDSGHVVTKYDFIPSIGTHFFRFRNSWIKVDRTREQHTLDLHMGIPWETVTLTTLGNNKQLFFDILEEARHMALQKTEGQTIMYVPMGSEWRQFGHAKKKRPIASVVLDGDISQSILADVKEFIANDFWYSERGIPYRRGYLLYGPPGCGKSSFITALAGELDYGICVLNLSERSLSDDKLNHLLSEAPQNTILLLEDVDAAFVNRETTKSQSSAYEGMSRVTFSGLLNCLDGVASAEGRILFMTTNYIDRLDAALIRPGRVDYKEYIGYCSQNQMERMYRNFYQESDEQSAQLFATEVASKKKNVSAAQLQGFFMKRKKDDFESLVANVEQIWDVS